MKYILLDYVIEAGWPALTRAEQEHWLGVYRSYMETMAKAGVLKSSRGLHPTSAATTVRVKDGKTRSWMARTPRQRNSSVASTLLK